MGQLLLRHTSTHTESSMRRLGHEPPAATSVCRTILRTVAPLLFCLVRADHHIQQPPTDHLQYPQGPADDGDLEPVSS
jgi:hypothetical protein